MRNMDQRIELRQGNVVKMTRVRIPEGRVISEDLYKVLSIFNPRRTVGVDTKKVDFSKEIGPDGVASLFSLTAEELGEDNDGMKVVFPDLIRLRGEPRVVINLKLASEVDLQAFKVRGGRFGYVRQSELVK
jgi:hypothetical protein